MAAPKPNRLRAFAQKPVGKALLIALTLGILLGVEVYYSLLAIPAFLIFGLAFPIWLGLKRPRYLALSGLVVILLIAPLVTAAYTQEILTPLAAADSMTSIPGTNGTALLQNATVSPYTGSASTNFTWQVTVVPGGIPAGNSSTPINLSLYISTCPGATSTSPPSWCSAGYPFYQLNYSFNQSRPLSAPETITFHYRIGSNGIWDWQMGIWTKNGTTGKGYFQTLVGDPTYNGLEGPVIGGYWTTYFAILPTIYLFEDFLPLGASFFFILLLYMLFKNRERRKREAAGRAAGPMPSPSAPPSGGATGGAALPATPPKSPPPSAAPPTAAERTCPNCQAVVYENEKTCWKCGASLAPAAGPPLPSGGS